MCLQAACEDAAALYGAGQGADERLEPAEALLISMEVTASGKFGGTLSRDCQDGPAYLLERGVRELERSGAFDRVSGEILVYHVANLTDVVQDRAREWKATAIYVAVDERGAGEWQQTEQKLTGWRRFFGH